MNDLYLYMKNVLGHDFRNTGLLTTALTHRSFSREHNERFEFLGDALLGMFIADELFMKFPEAAESDLTRLRSSLVKQETLAQLARQLDLEVKSGSALVKIKVEEGRRSHSWRIPWRR